MSFAQSPPENIEYIFLRLCVGWIGKLVEEKVGSWTHLLLRLGIFIVVEKVVVVFYTKKNADTRL